MLDEWKAYFVIVVFIITMLFVIKPSKFYNIHLDYGNIPLMSIILLLSTTCTTWSDVEFGIIGRGSMKPYAIFILFFSLAYICISVDLTGVFKWLAIKIANKSGTSVKKLFCFIYAMNSIFTIFCSNDVSILTLTPILIPYCQSKNMDPLPMLFTQFFSSNCWSMLLYIGNPTNIIVAQALSLSFYEYSYWMFLPAVTAGIVCFISCYFWFHSLFQSELLKEEIQMDMGLLKEEIQMELQLESPKDAAFGMFILISCLITLIVTSFVHVEVWIATLPFFLVLLVKDIVKDVYTGYHSLPTIQAASSKMPWKVGPFLISMFILVETLDSVGWIQIFANVFKTWIAGNGSTVAIFVVSASSTFTCMLMNNQPMTILFTRILLHPQFAYQVTSKEWKASIFALCLGSNLGANFCINGALAGFLWNSILIGKGISVSQFLFIKNGFATCFIVLLASSSVLALEY